MTNYNKPALDYKDQVELLRNRGLTFPLISDEEYALKLLKRISYYRLSAYFLPLQDQKDKFKQNTTIHDIKHLYSFDQELRSLTLNSLKIIEISIRSVVTHELSIVYGPFSYIEESLYISDNNKFNDLISMINKEKNRSREVFLRHFKRKYTSSSDLPIWMATEIMSFGTLSRLYSLLLRKNQIKISRHYDLNNSILKNWLHCFTYTRNICAHHSRLWNRTLAIRPIIPNSWENHTEIDNRKIYSILTIINFLLKIIEPDLRDDFKYSIIKLLNKYKNVDNKALDFPENWSENSLWK